MWCRNTQRTRSPPDRTFKLQPFLLQSEFDLALVDPIETTLQKRAYRPLAPIWQPSHQDDCTT
jgi:hypothetical protein